MKNLIYNSRTTVFKAVMLAFMLVSSSYGSSKDVNTVKKDIQVANMEMEQTVSLDRVKIYGWLGERVDRSYRAVENLRSSIWWNQGEIWGWEHPARWLRNMSMFSAYTGYQSPSIAEEAERFIKMYDTKELFVDYKKLPAGPYEDSEVLKGLLAYYEISGDQRVLSAAKGVGQYIVDNHFKTTHYYKPLAIGILIKLSLLSGDVSFKKLAIEIAEEQQLAILKINAHGAAAAMVFDGYLDIYEITGNRRYLDWALEGWHAMRNRMFVTGGIGEILNFAAIPSESNVMCETCQVSWWMMLNLHLWRATGNTEFLDMAERILYNHFAFSQAHRGEGGGFYAFGNIDQVVRGVHNYYCCDNEGTLGCLNLLQHIYTQNTENPIADINFFFDSEARLDIGGQEVRIRQTTDYPERGYVKVSFGMQSPAKFILRFRIPKWTNISSAMINGKSVDYKIKDSYLLIDRKWMNDDVLSIVFPMSMRVEADMTGIDLRSGAVRINGKNEPAKRLAVFYGPILSAMFRTGHGNDLSWVWTGDYTDVLDCGGDASLGYPTSKSDILELDGKTFDSGIVPEITYVESGNSVPEISWKVELGDKVQVKYTVKVLPGLPVTLESSEEIVGWDGRGRLLCSGLRFATIKTGSSSYGQILTPYPLPCVTTKPDLDNHVLWAGIYGLQERMADNARLPVTGSIFLNNGYFSAINLYDPKPVNEIVCRQTEMFTGLYLRPKSDSNVVLSSRLVFPLADRPQNQTTALHRMQKATKVVAELNQEGNLTLSGSVLEGVSVIIPKSKGIKVGWVIHNEKIASSVLDYDNENVIVYVDVPGTYQVERLKNIIK